jgi:hypothetical protein
MDQRFHPRIVSGCTLARQTEAKPDALLTDARTHSEHAGRQGTGLGLSKSPWRLIQISPRQYPRG